MFNPNLITAQDLKEIKKIERARQFDEVRKPRIFNARQRLIGVDIEALEKQIEEKKMREEAEKAESKAYYLKEIHDVDVADTLERQVNRNKKLISQEVNIFRKLYQKREDRREFDLNDPDWLKKSLPCRISDDDPRLSISSVQIFEGEDSVGNERKKIQAEQQKNWLLQQIAERRQKEKEKKSAEKTLLETLKARDARVKMMEKLEKECQRQIEQANVAYNQALAYEQAQVKRLKEEMEIENNKTEIMNALTSDLLTENTEVAQSNLGLDKQVGALYKGMSQEQKNEILHIQEKQREELQARRESEKIFEKYWLHFANSLNDSIYALDSKAERERKEKLKELLEYNNLLSKEQKAHKEYLDKVVYNNLPTAGFYKQFNKSTR